MTEATPDPSIPSPRWWQRRAGRLTLLGGVAVALLGAAWLGRTLLPTGGPTAALLRPAALAIIPRVYLLGKSAPGAVYAVETSQGLVLIDSGLHADASAVRYQLDELGLDVSRLRAILLTHAHADHVLGAARLRASTGARIHAGRADCPPLREGGPREAFFSTFHMPGVAIHPTTVDVELAGGESLDFGDTRFTVLATPGHSPGSTCYLLERQGLRALFTGDVIQHLGPGMQGTLGTYIAYLPPLYRGNGRDYLASLERLRDLPTPDLVLPGHPQMDGAPENPSLSPTRWHELLDGGIAELRTLLARHEADGASFLDGNPKQLLPVKKDGEKTPTLPALHYLGDLAGRAVYCIGAANGVVLFDAPGGEQLVDFLNGHLQRLGLAERKLVAVLLTSCDESAISGLPSLVRRNGCAVVAAKLCMEDVRRVCPAGTNVIAAEEVDKAPWGSIEGLARPTIRGMFLAGRGISPVAYVLRWEGKTVLLSGRIPVKPSVPAMTELMRDLSGFRGNRELYLGSIQKLGELHPDLWLPAEPVHGQNANLYDLEWDKLLEMNQI